MRIMIFSLRDSKMAAFMQPFFAPTEAVALRLCSDLVNQADKQNQVALHPDDFELFQLGEWDDASGALTSLEHARAVVPCSSLVRA